MRCATCPFAGAIPIYLGAPNIAAFAPHPHSYLLVSDFASITALAAHVWYLAHNDTARLEYLAFKDPAVPLAPGFLRASRWCLPQFNASPL
eukprot:3375671-Rhodomonas_salina.1